MKTKKIRYSLLFAILFSSTLGWAQEESFIDYDSIVDKLSVPTTSSGAYNDHPFANILLHAGVSMAMSMTSIEQDNKTYNGFLRGVELNLGIDLFSRKWMAEGTYRNLGETQLSLEDRKDIISINEFDMEIVYRTPLGRLVALRTGFGLAARYMTYSNTLLGKSFEYTTPSSLLSLGLDAKLSRSLSFGAEISYRNAMVDETIDKSALAAGIRVDAHF